MKIAVIGTGYVGSVTGACFAEMGNTVVCVDKDERKIAQFESGKAPLHEKGLDELVVKNLKNGTLSFTTDFDGAVRGSDILFIAVGTPPSEDGSADLSHVLAVADGIGSCMDHELIVVDKSTVPVGTAALVSGRIAAKLAERGEDIPFSVVSNPEFLAQGTAVKDFLEPSRVVVGSDDPKPLETMRELYGPFMRREGRFFAMDAKTAEIVKYASNCFLAVKISAANELANICSKAGADYENVRKAMGADPRIGEAFLYASAGFGGSCFPKDVKALIRTAEDLGYDARMLRETLDTNERQKHVLGGMVADRFGDDLSGKVFAVWGLAFKAGTDDMRESPAIPVVNDLIAKGATVRAYDPEAMHMAKTPDYFGDNPSIAYFDDKYEALEGADAMLLVTEWKEFRTPDFDRIREALREPVIFDGRLLYEPKRMADLGIEYRSIGR
ncbi:MAG: UDP-glucose/GDP-mannose dehydrogenase family protein [Candidatus Moranbacteria bacterium]|nr:UDP-glucose/GDP-mannose dehydrogenase family protein [Candidatus Moranbacteria bacterium]NTW45565.1 UDP-glucose/GDP-mannose dehydrogenase family protein [Candidatus Moranbacteria bacterium]